MKIFDSSKLDPRKYGFDRGIGNTIIFDSNLFQECPSCKGKGMVEAKNQKIEKCHNCDGTGAVVKM